MNENEITKSEFNEIMNVQYLPSIKDIDIDLSKAENIQLQMFRHWEWHFNH